MKNVEQSFSVGHQVEIVDTENNELDGKVGIVIDTHYFFGVVNYMVEFNENMSKHTYGKSYTTQMCISGKNLKLYEDSIWYDYKTLINLALDTKDEHWFNELVEKKQMQAVF